MYVQYTRVFGTCKEPQKSIKFSPFYRVRGPQKILLYFWGEGANEQKTNKRIKRVCLFKRKICDAYAPSHEPVKNPVISSKFCRFGKENSHQNSAVLGKILFNQILAVLRGVVKPAFLWRDYLYHCEAPHCGAVAIPRQIKLAKQI